MAFTQRAVAVFIGSLVFGNFAQAQVTVFNTDFEYTTEPTSAAIGTDASNLNFADSQIGTFFGTTSGPSGGSQFSGTGSIFGFQNHPDTGTRLLWVDRPSADTSFGAQFTEPVEVDGASVNFHVVSRRTQGNSQAKDYDIVGFDENSNELFRLTVSTNNNSATRERLGVVHGGGTTEYDLVTTFGGVGSDGVGDLDNLGAPAFDPDEIGFITLDLTDAGYTIDFTNDNGSNAYTTGLIPFNGTPDSLFSQIIFEVSGGADGVSSGFVLDDFSVSGFAAAVPEPASIAIWSLLGVALAGFGYYRVRRK